MATNLYPTITSETPNGITFPALIRVLRAFGFGDTAYETARRMRDAFIINGGRWTGEDGAAQLDGTLYAIYGANKDRYVELVDARARRIVDTGDWALFCRTLLGGGPAVAIDVYSMLIDLTVSRN